MAGFATLFQIPFLLGHLGLSSMNNDANPRISVLLRGVTWLEVVILFWAGLGLLFYPPSIELIWPWPLAPFNLRFMGALYTAALIAAFVQAMSGRWSPSRVVTPMIFFFTLVVTIYSFVHIERFDPDRFETWIWFVLYIGVCVNAGVHLWLYRRLPLPQPSFQPLATLRSVLSGVFIVLGGYGLLLLLVPATASVFWPWKLDTFHAQLYSVTFLTPAVGAGVLLRGATRGELKTLGLTLAAWGLLPIIGLVLADASVHRVRWTVTDTWLWLALFSGITGVGAWLATQSRKTAWQEIVRRQEATNC
jgi:hypothetical protein